MEPSMNEVMQSVTELRKTVETRLDDCITREKAEKLVEDVVHKLHPVAAPKMKLADTQEEVMDRAEAFKSSPFNIKSAPWNSEYGRKFGSMGGYLKAIRSHSADLKAYTGMNEGTPGDGGYLVPTEFSATVFRLMRDLSIIMRIANVIPMNTWKRTFPKQLTNPTIYWPGEAGSKTSSKPTFGQVAQEAKVMAAVIKCTDELLRDSAIDLESFIAGIVAEAMALEIEYMALVGNTGVSNPFMGVRYASGVNVVPMNKETVSFDDIIDLHYSLSQSYADGALTLLSRGGLKKLIKLKDERGQYIWTPPAGNVPAMIWGAPYELSSQIPDNLGDGGDETLALFGNFKKYLLVSPRESIQVLASREASDAGDQTNAFLQDQTWLRFTSAVSVDVAVGGAFSYLQFK